MHIFANYDCYDFIAGEVQNQIRTLQGEVSSLSPVVSGLENEMQQVSNDVRAQDETVKELRAKNMTKLERENVLWKGNFRTINSTLAKIKRKIGMPVT
jgi:hypothetical protein